jgi:hypothetical protein
MLMGQSHRLGFAGAQARDFNNYCSTFGVRSTVESEYVIPVLSMQILLLKEA